MGCGSSKNKGRDNYATLSADPEPLTPLVRSEPDELPRLDSFLPIPDSGGGSGEGRNQSAAIAKKNKGRDFPVAPGYTAETKAYDLQQQKLAASTPQQQLPSAYDTTQSSNTGGQRKEQSQPSNGGESSTDLSFSDLRKAPENPQQNFPSNEQSITLEAVFPNTQEIFESAQGPQQGTENSEPAPPTPGFEENRQSTDSGELSPEPKEAKKKKKKKSSKPQPGSKQSDSPNSPSTMIRSGSSAQQDDTPHPNSKSGMRFEELYKLKGVLGTGAFSTVREGYHKSSSTNSYAVKCVNRKKLSEEDEAALLDEVAILKEMRHVHIIRLYDFFVETHTYYLVMERMSGGELFDRIVAKAYYSEKEARDVCKIVLEAVAYCHENNVAHRDLKPENLLLLGEDDDSTVKIADFGFAKKVFAPHSLTTQCGTPGYVAPEILEGIPYDTRADMWSVGVILYILLGGYPPFIENNQRDLFRKIRRGEYEFHEEYWGTVSADAKDLISSLLTVDPETRLNASQALGNQWIRGDDKALAKRDLGNNLKELTKFNAKRKFKAAVSTVMAVNKLQSLGQEFLRSASNDMNAA